MGNFDDTKAERAQRTEQEIARRHEAERAQQAYDEWLHIDARAALQECLRKHAESSPPRTLGYTGRGPFQRRIDAYVIARPSGDPGDTFAYLLTITDGELYGMSYAQLCGHYVHIEPPSSLSEWDPGAATEKLVAYLAKSLVT
jgi:hypothetical protein